MEEIKRRVSTEFTVEDRQALQALGSMASAFEGTGALVERTTSLFSPLTAALGGVAAAFSTKSIAQLGSQFEQTSIAIAGFLSALGFTKDFNSGLEAGAATMEKIRISAAALPGEAEDYIEVFKMGLPFVAHAVKGSLDDMTAFTNRYTAITQTLQIDTAQAARDLQLLLNEGVGRAGMHVKAWTQLLPFMKQVEKQADITAEKFNKMTNVERAELLNKTFEKLDPMLKASATTFDAMWGAIVSNTKMMLRVGSAPIFEGMKTGLEKLNNALFDSNGQMTELASRIVHIGVVISDSIVGGVKRSIEWVDFLRDRFLGLGESGALKPVLDGVNNLIGRMASVFDQSTRAGPGGAGVGPFAAAAGAAVAITADISGPLMLILQPLVLGVMEFASHADAVAELFGNVTVAIEPLIGFFGELSSVMSLLGGIVADMLDRVLSPLVEGLGFIIKPVAMFASGLLQVVQVVIGQVRPVLTQLWSAIGDLVVTIGSTLGAALSFFYAHMMNVVAVIGEYLVPVLKFVVTVFSELINALTALFKFIRSLIPGSNIQLPGEGQPSAPARDYIGEFFAKFKMGAEDKKPAVAGGGIAGQPQEARGGKGVVQDFRYSRFEITQAFAQGFDPDRIAVAFAQDLGRMGEQKLQSGFEPLFGVR